jgi:glycosyltransferase involved in cell wall biosynthesis
MCKPDGASEGRRHEQLRGVARTPRRQKVFGTSPLSAFLRLNGVLWKQLLKYATAVGPVVSFRRFLHKLCRIQGERGQLLDTLFLRNCAFLELVRRVVANRDPRGELRVAALGCSAGAEAYSVARRIRSAGADLNLVMQAVDISRQEVEIGKRGTVASGAGRHRPVTAGLKVLILVPNRLPDDRHQAVRQGDRPQADYDALASALCETPGGRGDILDLASIDRDGDWLIRCVRRLLGPYWALAALGHQRCGGYDAVFSHGEFVGVRFALIAALCRRRRRRHVMTAYYLVGRRNAIWYRVVRVQRGIDTILTEAREQYEFGRSVLRLPVTKLTYVEACGYVDTKFFAERPAGVVDEKQICSAGRENRDYETLISAMAGLPDVRLKFDPSSPWSLQRSDVASLKLPPNVQISRMAFGEIWHLYAASAAVVVPLHPNAIAAGTTTMVEAMSMGKPVIITQSSDGSFAGRAGLANWENVILVKPHDVTGLRCAIMRVMADTELRACIGANARRWAVRYAGRDQWLGVMLRILSGAPADTMSPQ